MIKELVRKRSFANSALSVVLLLTVCFLVLVIGKREVARVTTKLPDPSSPVFVQEWKALLTRGVRVGDSSAKVQIIEFVDFQCPACRLQHTELKEILKDSQTVAITYVHFPLQTHPFAVPAATAAQCAKERFGQFADLLFVKQDSIGLRTWERFRVDGGVTDSTEFHACLSSNEAKLAVESAKEAGKDFAIVATPTLIINGWRFEGVLSSRYLKATIASILDGKPPGGVVSLLGSSAGHTADTINGAPRVIFDQNAFRSTPRYSVAPVPLATMDGTVLPPDFDLTTVTQVEVVANGELVVFSGIGARVLLFSPEGTPEGRIGRMGRGPGELIAPSNIAKAFGDTMVMLDAANNKFVLVVPSKGIVAERSLDVSPPSPIVRVAGGLPSKSLVVYWNARMPNPAVNATPQPRGVEVGVMSLSGKHSRIATLPGQLYRTVLAKYGAESEPIPDYVRLSSVAHVAVWDSVIVIASSDAYRLDLLSETGRSLGQVVATLPKRAVSRDMRRKMAELELERLTGGGEALRNANESRRLIQEAMFADSLPAFEALHVGADKRLWIVDAIAPGDSGWTATALQLDGTISGRLHAGRAGRPMAFGRDRVVVRETNEDGVVSLRVLKIVQQ